MGYIYNRMSERAAAAYDSGERPLSKWSKDDIIEQIEEVRQEWGDDLPDLSDELERLTKVELVEKFLYQSSWHHTGPYYVPTNFFAIEVGRAVDLTVEDIKKTIESRPPRAPRVKKPKAAKVKPTYVTALLEFNVTRHERRYYFSERVEAGAQYMSDQKMIRVPGYGNRRLSACRVLKSIEQKTRFAPLRRVER